MSLEGEGLFVCLCESAGASFQSVRASFGGSETDLFFLAGSDQIYSPHLIVTRPHAVKDPRVSSTNGYIPKSTNMRYEVI